MVTKVLIERLCIGLRTYESDFGDFPGTSLSSLGFEPANHLNEGIECAVLSLSKTAEQGPYMDWEEGMLANCDKDQMNQPLAGCSLKTRDLFEAVDAWGNPLVYLHHRDYGKTFRYKDSKGKEFEIRAAKGRKQGEYECATSFQLWSIGPNGVNENGSGDDIANFSKDEEDK